MFGVVIGLEKCGLNPPCLVQSPLRNKETKLNTFIIHEPNFNYFCISFTNAKKVIFFYNLLVIHVLVSYKPGKGNSPRTLANK